MIKVSSIFTLLFASLILGRGAGSIDFNRDIHPILSENCFACHGPDSNKRKAGLRLDQKEEATRLLESGKRAIDPANLGKSAILERILTEDEEDRMPPPKSGKKLSAAQIKLLKDWIHSGAQWKQHWAYTCPKRARVPSVNNRRWIRNEIDAFILARLEKEGLHPSIEADRPTLIRRLSLDLTGLPPTLAEVDAFVADRSPDAYEKLVDGLLSSEAFGERMAQIWLDLARYADTNGYHIDNHRDMWKWREWVINAFNHNKPFDQFTIEQLAGDLLPQATLDQKVATGFNRNNMVNFEGGADPEEYMSKYLVDRVATTANVWLGSTLGCAECHDHKYDPFTQKEFYQFVAFFNNVPERGLDGQKSNPVPSIKVPTRQEETRLAELSRKIANLESSMNRALTNQNERLEAEQTAWERGLIEAEQGGWTLIEPKEASSTNGADLKILPDQSILASGKNPETDVFTIKALAPSEGITGIRLETLVDPSLPFKSAARSENGNFVLTDFSVQVSNSTPATIAETPRLSPWQSLGPFKAPDGPASFGRKFIDEPEVKLDQTYAGGSLRWTPHPDWKDGEIITFEGEPAAVYLYRTITVAQARAWKISLGSDDGVQGWLNGKKFLSRKVERPVAPDQEEVTLLLKAGENRLLFKVNNVAGGFAFYFRSQVEIPREYNVAFAGAVADFSQKDFPPTLAIDTDRKSGWAIAGYEEANRVNHQAIFISQQAFGAGKDADLTFKLKFESPFKQHVIGRFRLAVSTVRGMSDLAEIPEEIRMTLHQPAEKRNHEQLEKLARYFRTQHVPEIADLDRELKSVREQRQKLEDSLPQTMVMEEMAKPRDTFILVRGNFQNRGEKVSAKVPHALPQLRAGQKADRLALARWLVSAENPLCSRVTVNRFWQMLFGVGLVKTSNDFGSQGEWPSHPELLDWLACEFMQPASFSQPHAQAWDIKHMIRLMVTSSTYRQASIGSAKLLERDRDNRLLARGARFRVDAEVVRDNALAVSGLLNRKIGGESVRPYQPAGLWEAMAFGGEFSSQTYVQSHGSDLYRRGIYVYWKRSLPYPSLITFDAPNREVCTAMRPRTTTPLQALVLMNDPAFVEASRALGERVMQNAARSMDERLTYGFRLVLARKPSPRELAILRTAYSEQLSNFRSDPKAAKDFLTIGESPKPAGLNDVELAAWTAVGNLLLNLDETITRN